MGSGIKRLEVWAEGALGKAHLEVLSISAAYDTANIRFEQAALAARTALFEKQLMASSANFGKIEVASPSDMVCPPTAASLANMARGTTPITTAPTRSSHTAAPSPRRA